MLGLPFTGILPIDIVLGFIYIIGIGLLLIGACFLLFCLIAVGVMTAPFWLPVFVVYWLVCLALGNPIFH